MDAKTKAKALSLLSSVSSSSFLVSLTAAKKVMSLTYKLSKYLQSPKLDLFHGTEMACSIIEYLQSWRLWMKAYGTVVTSVYFLDVNNLHRQLV